MGGVMGRHNAMLTSDVRLRERRANRVWILVASPEETHFHPDSCAAVARFVLALRLARKRRSLD